MDIRKLQRAIVDGLEDVKGQQIAVFNTEHLSSMFERVIIASGTSNRQTRALAASVRDAVKSRGMPVLSTEGEDNGEWIVVDCGAAVAHIMQPAIRDYYHLEEIWGGKAVRMKVGEVSHKLVKASEPEPEPEVSDAPARRAAAKKGTAKPASAKTAGFKKRPTPEAAAQLAAKKAGNRTAAFKRVAAKTAPRKTAAHKTAARKAAPRPSAPAGKTVLKNASPRKSTRPG
jgi:ribosome-associated protein